MISDSIVDDLTKLGLTFNEARAYKALVMVGSSNARRIAEISGVPRSKVYETLGSLERKGFVQRILGKEPATFQALPPRATIEHLRMKLEASSDAVLTALETLERERESIGEEFVWTTQGKEQITLDIISTFDRARKSIFIATRRPSLVSPLRSALARAKSRGVVSELHTTGTLMDKFSEFKHYMVIHSAIPSSAVLVENIGHVLQEIKLESIGGDPDAMSIIVVDGNESIAVFNPTSDSQKPWGLHIRNPLIVMIQWQVVKTVLSTIESLTGWLGKRPT